MNYPPQLYNSGNYEPKEHKRYFTLRRSRNISAKPKDKWLGTGQKSFRSSQIPGNDLCIPVTQSLQKSDYNVTVISENLRGLKPWLNTCPI